MKKEKLKNKRSMMSILMSVLMCMSLVAASVISVSADAKDFRITGDWEKYEPCNELAIGADIIESSIIGGKMTGKNPFVIWTAEPVDDSAKDMIVESLSGVPGVGKIKDVEFIYGDEAYSYGMQIAMSDGMILLDEHSSWSLIFRNNYEYVVESDGETKDVTEELPEETIPEETKEIEELPEETKETEEIPEEETKESKEELPEETIPEEETKESTEELPEETSKESIEEVPKEETKEPVKEQPKDSILDEPVSDPKDTIPESPVEEVPEKETEIIEDITPHVPERIVPEKEIIIPSVTKVTDPQENDNIPSVPEVTESKNDEVIPSVPEATEPKNDEVIPSVSEVIENEENTDSKVDSEKTEERILDDQPYTGAIDGANWRALTLVLGIVLLATIVSTAFIGKDEK